MDKLYKKNHHGEPLDNAPVYLAKCIRNARKQIEYNMKSSAYGKQGAVSAELL